MTLEAWRTQWNALWKRMPHSWLSWRFISLVEKLWCRYDLFSWREGRVLYWELISAAGGLHLGCNYAGLLRSFVSSPSHPSQVVLLHSMAGHTAYRRSEVFRRRVESMDIMGMIQQPYGMMNMRVNKSTIKYPMSVWINFQSKAGK